MAGHVRSRKESRAREFGAGWLVEGRARDPTRFPPSCLSPSVTTTWAYISVTFQHINQGWMVCLYY
jgi:hypothetical protein